MTEHNEHRTFKADEIPSQEISDPAVLPKTPLVSVNMTTYNHEPYIAQAIEGALMQKTNFPYVVLIGEDDSSDGTREICKEYAAKYPDKIRLFLNDRRNVIYVNGQPTARWNFINLLKNTKGKYIALCPGDDYWIDPYKLQKQVDFLEANPEYGMVHSELSHFYVKSGRMVERHWEENGVVNQEGDIYEDLLCSNKSMVYFCTACFRSKYVVHNQQYNTIIAQNYPMGDAPLAIHIASQSKIAYMPEVTAVRRVLLYSATQGRSFEYWDDWYKRSSGIFDFFNNIRPVKDIGKIQEYKIKKIKLILNLSYAHRKKEVFLKNYSKLMTKDVRLRIMNIGIRNPMVYFFSKIALKILRKLKLTK